MYTCFTARCPDIELVDTNDGTYLVRVRPGHPGEYVLCVVYKGKPTHHLIMQSESGTFFINKKAFGQNKTVEAVSVDKLAYKCFFNFWRTDKGNNVCHAWKVKQSDLVRKTEMGIWPWFRSLRGIMHMVVMRRTDETDELAGQLTLR